MNVLTNPRCCAAVFTNALTMLSCVALVHVIADTPLYAEEGQDEVHLNRCRLAGDPHKPKSIFVFLDGTANDQSSRTNVWQLYDLISKNNDPQTMCAYLEGVGTANDPFDTRHFGSLEQGLELALGMHMQDRILAGYEFIAHNYNPGDDIYIFGFSRGAHQARSLAGLLAYAGVPKLSDDDREQIARDRGYLKEIGNDILKLAKKKRDKDYEEQWRSWSSGQMPLLAEDIAKQTIHGKRLREVQATEVTFLGVWDTVPGSSFKNYGRCKEEIGFWKTYFFWLPVITEGERYKSDSYPAIRRIAHAVSLDEKRSKFRPILVCPAIANSNPTSVTEVWFPGAHADVGGGYDDSDGLPGLSFNWMLGLLAESYTFNASPQVKESSTGLAHWPMGDDPANLFSECEDRHAPVGAQIHTSFNNRKKSSPVPIRMKGTVQSLTYPMDCPAR